jgi:hypothetical protein
MPSTEQKYQALEGQDIPNVEAGRLPPVELDSVSSSDEDGEKNHPSRSGSLKRSQVEGTPQRSPPKIGEHAATMVDGRKSRQPRRWFGVRLVPSKRVCIVLSIVAVAVVAAAIGGGAWVYKSAPPDGLSPPWYPAPLGGTVKSWDESYTKAREMVSKMDVMEKVNLTTGTG